MSRPFHCYEYVNREFAVVEAALAGDPVPLLKRATTAASSAPNAAASLHVEVGPIEVGAAIELEVTNLERRVSPPNPRTTLGLRWRAATAQSVFPEMEADLVIFPLSSTETQLDLISQYRPPLGLLGEVIDGALLHGLAEASVARFLREVAAHLRIVLAEVPRARDHVARREPPTSTA